MTEETTLSLRISSLFAGRSLLDFHTQRFKYQTCEQWKLEIGRGKVTVNGKAASIDYLLEIDDIVAYSFVHTEPPVDINIQIMHEEESFLVANKPGNLPSHADGKYIKNTLIFLLRQRLADKGFRGAIHLAHRLDRETSGIIVTAKTKTAHQSLLRQFEARTVEKEYIAIVRGVINNSSFEVKGFLVPDQDSCISIRKKVVSYDGPGAKYSATAFEVMERFASSTMVRCRPVTGRTNQIRAHLAHAGFPLVGDKLYGRTDEEFLHFAKNVRAGCYDLPPWLETPRHLLHASRLIINHPVSGELLVFNAPVPEDMKSFILEKTVNHRGAENTE
jgi:RluA family pseudouridine synthase